MKTGLRPFKPWPRNLTGRTVLLLLVSLTVFHLGSLWIHQHGPGDAVAEQDETKVAGRLISAARVIATLPAGERDQAAHALSDAGLSLSWNPHPSVTAARGEATGTDLRSRLIHGEPAFAAARFSSWSEAGPGLLGSLLLADGSWLNVAMAPIILPQGGMGGTDTLVSTIIMAIGIVAASVLLARWLNGPLRRLAQAADGIGRGRAVAMPRDGPEEVLRVARALDAMQSRIARLMDVRTQALAAVSHDLRTPITRLRLRAGFLDDRETQARMDADLDEMEEMIAATLAYLRGEADTEPSQLTDIGALLSTLCHAAADAGGLVSFAGPPHLDMYCHPVALRRAVSNLIGNAVSYGGDACVRLEVGASGPLITIEDHGPGIPETELERVFEPFHRLEASRNRGGGGVGLGLTIARQGIEEQGGALTLSTRPGGGLRAVIRLPNAGQGPGVGGEAGHGGTGSMCGKVPHASVRPFLKSLSLALFMVLAAPPPATASVACENLPPSVLEILSIQAVDRKELIVTTEELERDYPPGMVIERHAGMLIVRDVVGWHDITHRMISRDDGSVCDSPELVRIGLGSTGRMILLARDFAGDGCVRRRVLDHEEVHDRVLNEVVARFIDEQRGAFQQAMKLLKQTPAPDADSARAGWTEGLRTIVSVSVEKLMVEIREAFIRVEDPSALVRPCTSKIKHMESGNDAK